MRRLRGAFLNVLLAILAVSLLAACGSEPDDAAPGIRLVSTMETPTNQTDQSFQVAVTDGTAVAVSVNTGATGNAVPAGADLWDCTVTGLAEGENIVTVTASDPTGNTRSLLFFLRVDTVAEVTFDQFLTNSSNTDQTIAGTVEEGGTVRVAVNGQDLGQAALEPPVWSLDLTGLSGDGVPVVHTVEVTATDTLGNSNSLTREITFDPLAPRLTVFDLPLSTGDPDRPIEGAVTAGLTLTLALSPAGSPESPLPGPVVRLDGPRWSAFPTWTGDGLYLLTASAGAARLQGLLRLDRTAP